MGMLSKTDILNANDLPRRKVHVPEWGGDIEVRGLTGAEAATLFRKQREAERKHGDNDPEIMADFIIASAMNGDGEQLFTEGEREALLAKGVAPLRRVFDVALDISGITDKAAEELEKN